MIYLKLQPHEKLPCLVLSNDERPSIHPSVAGACMSIDLMRRPFLLRAGKMNFAVREWTHKSTFVAAASLPSRQVAMIWHVLCGLQRSLLCQCFANESLGALLRVTQGRVAFHFCDAYPCCFHASRSPLFVAVVGLLLLPLSLCDDADGAICTDAYMLVVDPVQQCRGFLFASTSSRSWAI
jgi:hypothetical protein